VITDGNLYLHQAQIGPMENFVYILADLNTRKCAVIDPAWDIDYFITHIKAQEFELESIFLTHGHGDHINGVEDLLKFKNVPVYLHSNCLYQPPPSTTISYTDPIINQDDKKTINRKVPLGELALTVIPTPGHSPGGQCFLYNKTLIAGDTTFINGCGHCRLQGANINQLFQSIQLLKSLGDDINIYPGHDYGPTGTDTIGNQKKTNPFFTNSQDKFTELRKG
jgi:hydroxyacylglutathione hydrolase